MVAKDFLHEDGRQSHRGLVEEQDLGASHERPTDRQHLLLAPRERCGGIVPLVTENGIKAEHLRQPPRPLRGGKHVPAEHEIVLHTERPEHLPALGRLADAALHPLIGRRVGDVGAGRLDPAPGAGHDARDHAQQGGLAGAVRADERDELALPQAERHAVQHLDTAVMGRRVLHRQDIVGHDGCRGGRALKHRPSPD
jgi:hypothetical protein